MSQGFNNIKNMAKTGLEYSPYVGDAIDIGEGLYQATHGHPWLGAGQTALGIGGMATNFIFPGAGSIGKAAVKGAVKGTAKKAVTKAPSILEKFARWNRSGKGMVQSTALPNIGYWISDEFKKPQGIDSDNSSSVSNNIGGKGVRGMGGQPTTQAQALALAQQLGSNPPVASQQDTDAQQANINAINDYITKLQEANRPYTDALQNYYNNYNKHLNDYHRARDFYTGLAGWSGNNLWADVGKDYNTVANEANKLSIAKQLQDNEVNNLNAINEMVGNLAMAEEMGLPPEAAFANKNLLTMMAARDREANRYQIALENNLMKKYGIDRNYARALTVQAMRGQNALDVAGMYTGAYGNSSGVAPGLDQKGNALKSIYQYGKL